MTDARKFGVFTCDRGHRVYDADLESTATLASVIQEIVENGFWRELARVPIDVIVRVLPPSTSRRTPGDCSRSGLKNGRTPDPPPELREWQGPLLRAAAAAPWAKEATFGGATALAVVSTARPAAFAARLRSVEDVGRLARLMFEAGPNPITLAEKLMLVETIEELPDMIRPVTIDEIRRFFVDLARKLVRNGP